MKEHTYQALSFALPLTVYLLTLNALWASDHPDSLLDLQYSLVVNHSAFFPESIASNSIDVSDYMGYYTSALAPGSAILSAPFGALGIALDKRFTLFGYERLFDEAFVALCASTTSLMVYRISRLFWSAHSSFLCSLSFGFGSLAWPYATAFFQHDIAMPFVTTSLYFTLNQKPKIAGILLGVALFVDYTSALFGLPLVWYLSKRKEILEFGLGFLASSSATFIYNYALFGNPVVFPEFYWVGGSRFLLSRFTPLYAPEHLIFLLLSPYRGLFLFSPISAFGLYGIYLMRKAHLERPSTLLLASFLVNILFYSFWGDWNGGLCYGPRFLVESLPFLFVPLSHVLDETNGRLRPLISISYAYSVVIQALGALTSVFSEEGTVYFYQPFEFNLHLLLKGEFTTWWMNSALSLRLNEKMAFAFVLLFSAIAPFIIMNRKLQRRQAVTSPS